MRTKSAPVPWNARVDDPIPTLFIVVFWWYRRPRRIEFRRTPMVSGVQLLLQESGSTTGRPAFSS